MCQRTFRFTLSTERETKPSAISAKNPHHNGRIGPCGPKNGTCPWWRCRQSRPRPSRWPRAPLDHNNSATDSVPTGVSPRCTHAISVNLSRSRVLFLVNRPRSRSRSRSLPLALPSLPHSISSLSLSHCCVGQYTAARMNRCTIRT